MKGSLRVALNLTSLVRGDLLGAETVATEGGGVAGRDRADTSRGPTIPREGTAPTLADESTQRGLTPPCKPLYAIESSPRAKCAGGPRGETEHGGEGMSRGGAFHRHDRRVGRDSCGRSSGMWACGIGPGLDLRRLVLIQT